MTTLHRYKLHKQLEPFIPRRIKKEKCLPKLNKFYKWIQDTEKLHICDAVYPLMTFLLKPFINPPVESPESRYNKHIIQARSSVERCIGILKGRWRCLRKERALHYKPEFAACIINACCVLHNIAIKWRLPLEEMYLDNIDQDLPMPYNDNDANNTAEEIRRNIVRWHFQQ